MRVQSFEFGDQAWVPEFYHSVLRDFMGALYKAFGHHKLWTQAILDLCENNPNKTIKDPCAGSGHVNLMIRTALPASFTGSFELSDLMIEKNIEFAKQINALKDSGISYKLQPTDATKSTPEDHSPKLFINSFHHFDHDQVGQILKHNAENGNDILILEYCRKSPDSLIAMFFGPVLFLLFLPFIWNRKNRLPCVLFTYLLPLIPLMLLWDGIISCLRTYSAKDLHAILERENIPHEPIRSSLKRSALYPSGVTSTSVRFKRPS